MQIRLQGIRVRLLCKISTCFFAVLLVLISCEESKSEYNEAHVETSNTGYDDFIKSIEYNPDSIFQLLSLDSTIGDLDSLERAFLLARSSVFSGKFNVANEHVGYLLSVSSDNDSLRKVALKLKSIIEIQVGDYGGYNKTAREVLTIDMKLGDQVEICKSTANLSVGFHSVGQFDSALFYSEKAYRIALGISNKELADVQLRHMAPSLLELGMLDSAESILNRLEQSDGNVSEQVMDLINRGSIHNKREEYEQSRLVYRKALKLAQSYGDSVDISLIQNNLAYANYHLGKYDKAFVLLDSTNKINERIQQVSFTSSLNELQLKYEDLEKDSRITQLASQTEADRTFKIWLSLVSFLVVSILAFLFISYRNRLKNMKRLREEEHLRFQKEKELAALHSSLQALEEERKRVAMDLHDGIGVLASAARLRVSQVNKRIDDATLNKILNETDEVLNTITGDVRRIAHNIMPATLSKLGLKTAIEELLEKSPQSMDIEFKLKLEEVQLPKAKPHDITLYRICQELVNNALKHSQSTLVEISLSQKGNLVTLRYDDNGVGLSDKSGTGSGLDAMKSRIESLGGRMFVDKSSKTGTHIYFEVSNG